MANREQLKILKQGTKVWNSWRKKNKTAKINLSKVGLSRKNLSGANLRDADLFFANLRNVDLSRADLREIDLSGANLIDANLKGADLSGAKLVDAGLSGADLSESDLNGSELFFALLNGAKLGKANLIGANFNSADLSRANLENAIVGGTSFGDTNLTDAFGIEEVHHGAPSFINNRTLQLCNGRLPEKFLRGCGFSDWEIESAKLYDPDLTNEEIVKIQYRIFDLRATRALQISPLFISYSHTDTVFVDHIDQALTTKGVRFWRDIHNAKAGRLETQIDSAIRQNPTVLLVLSKNSLSSDWVEHEVRHARKLEKEIGRDVLCPIALDDAWKSSKWPERIIEQITEYNILDFSGWQDKSIFDIQFLKLLGGLEIFYKKPAK